MPPHLTFRPSHSRISRHFDQPKWRAVGRKLPSSWSSGPRFSMHQVPISRSMVLRTVMPRRRKERKSRAEITSPAIGTISMRRSRASTSRAGPLAVETLQHLVEHQIPTMISSVPEESAESPHMRRVAEVDPDAAVDNDHPLPRPLRLWARLPRLRYLPNAAPASCCPRNLTIKRSACSTVCFLFRCPEAFCASAISASSISILVRMADDPFATCIRICDTHPHPAKGGWRQFTRMGDGYRFAPPILRDPSPDRLQPRLDRRPSRFQKRRQRELLA